VNKQEKRMDFKEMGYEYVNEFHPVEETKSGRLL
jgi:hypothetical protein